MKKIQVEQAVGMTLCHDITAIRDGFKGALFKRGHVVTAEDIPELQSIGKKHIYIWEDNAGEVHEEDCALRMAAVNPVEGAHYDGPSEGKVVLTADRSGMFHVNKALLKEINRTPDVTITTIPDHFPVQAGSILASMRIVPLVTKEENILRVEELCGKEELLHLYPYEHKKVGIIVTGSELYSGRITDRFEPIARKKLAGYPCEILGVTICDDDQQMLTDAMNHYIELGADLLFCHGGMSVDPDDLTPSAIRGLGSEVVTYGVPAQPGNMLLVAYYGKTAIFGIPSAAIKSPASMFDVVLPQAFAGLKFTKDELLNLGSGSLCMRCPVCHYPNCTFGKY